MSPEAITIKVKKAGQRACDEKGDKGKLCVGHLKRWYTPNEEVVRELGKDIEIYRCERCHTLYRPAAQDRSTAGQRYELRPVNILGGFLRKLCG
ncbi:MAG: hypothetical protein HYS33_03465 [Acidobacteria bacterium]|nr:hypothetical protein [Acidobacteriota bacterium]